MTGQHSPNNTPNPLGLNLSDFLLAQIDKDEAAANRNDGNTHRDGVPWWEAPLPSRWHRCHPQTSGWLGMTLVERCACGALRRDGSGPWIERNSRRRNR